MGTHGRFLKAVFGILILVGFISFLLVGMLESSEEFETSTISYFRGARSLKHMQKVMTKEDDQEKLIGVDPVKSDHVNINYMSKRRVPNGSDPIHNRRAGNSGRPPGQS